MEASMNLGCLLQTVNSVRLVIASFAVLVLSGCLTATPIKTDDSRVFQPSVRADVSLDEGIQAPAEPQTGKAIEFGLARVKGSGSQTLAAGVEPVIYSNNTFTSPQQLKVDFDINYVDLSYRSRKFFREGAFGLEWSAGIGHTSMGLAVTSATQKAAARFNNYGVQGGVGLIWRMRPSTSLHTHVSAFASGAATGIQSTGRFELFLAQGLGDNLVLRAGYATAEVNGETGYQASDFQLRYNGPILDIGLSF
jgi:hypothetical protein